MKSRIANIVFGLLLLAIAVIDWQYGISSIFYWIVILIFSLVNFWGTINISFQYFISAKCSADKNDGSVAITFDDGPAQDKTSQVLEILKQYEVSATFFCIGKNVNEHPEIAKQINERGHIIGNHSYFHGTWFDMQLPKAIVKELDDTNTAIQQAIGKTPRLFRPPYGVTNPLLASAVKQTGHAVIGWSVRSFDTVTSDRKKLFNRVTRKLKSGDVILFHDRCESTIEILPEVLAHVKERGLKVVPLDQLLNEKAYV